MKKLNENEIEEMFEVAAKMIVTGQSGLKNILTKKALDLGLEKMDMLQVVSSLVSDYDRL